MAKVKIQGHASGTGILTVTAPNTSTDRTITLPDSTGTLVDDTTAVTKDSNNNVGIGVTPESWNSGWNTLQIGDGASIAGRTASGNVDISSNAYRDSTDNRWEYIGANGSEEAAKYTQFSGQHVFYTAPSGSADSAISWTTAMTIDNSGRVTMPSQPSFDAYVTNTNATFTQTVIIFDGISTHNVGSHYNTANGRFTAPVTGRYFFTYNLQKSGSTDTNTETQFQKNGSKLSDTHVHHTAKANHASQSVVWQLSANDYVDVKILGGTIKGDYTHFSGHLLG